MWRLNLKNSCGYGDSLVPSPLPVGQHAKPSSVPLLTIGYRAKTGSSTWNGCELVWGYSKSGWQRDRWSEPCCRIIHTAAISQLYTVGLPWVGVQSTTEKTFLSPAFIVIIVFLSGLSNRHYCLDHHTRLCTIYYPVSLKKPGPLRYSGITSPKQIGYQWFSTQRIAIHCTTCCA